MTKDKTPDNPLAAQLTHPTAERVILSALRAGETELCTTIIEALQATDFTEPHNRVVFQAYVNLWHGVEPIDDLAIVAECAHVARDLKVNVQINGDFLRILDEDTLRARAYIKTIKRMAWLRRAADFAFWFAEQLPTMPAPDDFYSEAVERFGELQPVLPDSRFVYGWDTVPLHESRIEQRVRERAAGAVNPFTWPWGSWNKMFRPLRPGMLGVLAAPDGIGKTTALEKIAEWWAINALHVVYVHLEDELDYKLDRRLARWARVGIDAIEDGNLTPDDVEKIEIAEQQLARRCNTLHYFHAPGMCMNDILRELESRVREGVCQAVVFDYLEKVQPSRAQIRLFGDNIWERQAADIEALKVFAERNKLPVFAAAQGSKAMQDGATQTRKNILGSSAKSQKAQLVIVMTRELVGKNGLRDSVTGELLATEGEYSPFCKMHADKQNRGKTGDIMQFFDGPHFDIRDLRIPTGKTTA